MPSVNNTLCTCWGGQYPSQGAARPSHLASTGYCYMALPVFGLIDDLVGISFPTTITAAPWWWWFTVQTPFYWQYVGTLAGGHGWQRTKNLPMIKILAADTQKLQPSRPSGWPTIDAAITQNPEQADAGWGRFRFTDDFFWDVIGQKKPPFDSIQGVPTALKQQGGLPITMIMKQVTTKFKGFWNSTAASFNADAQEGTTGGYYSFPATSFALPLPGTNNVADLANLEGKFYLGAVPGGFWFLDGAVEVYKQAYSFTINVAQLDPKIWDMSVFPPLKQPADFILQGLFHSSSQTKNYGGYGNSDLPLAGPQIVGSQEASGGTT